MATSMSIHLSLPMEPGYRFSTSRDDNPEIYLMNGDGTGLTRLTTNSASDLQPALQPGGVIPPPPAAGCCYRAVQHH